MLHDFGRENEQVNRQNIDKNKITAETYNVIAEDYAKEFCQDIYFKEELDCFLELVRQMPRVLDAGCSSGYVTRYIANKGYNAVGVDAAEGFINLAKREYPGLDFRVMDIRDMDFPDQSFNGIVATCVLTHMCDDDCKKTLKEFARVLKPGGHALLGLIEGDEDILIPELFNENYLTYFNFYQKDFIFEALKENGLEITKVVERLFLEEAFKDDITYNRNEFYVYARKK